MWRYFDTIVENFDTIVEVDLQNGPTLQVTNVTWGPGESGTPVVGSMIPRNLQCHMRLDAMFLLASEREITHVISELAWSGT